MNHLEGQTSPYLLQHVRRLRFLEPMTASLLTGHRVVPPYGLNGGDDGQCGINSVERINGQIDPLQGCDKTEMGAGDVLIIQTPTGGGFGKAGTLREAAE